MAENDKKGFSGLDDLIPKKKNRAATETKNTENPKSEPNTNPKKSTREVRRTYKSKYPKDDPYAFPSFDKITKNQWILIGFGILILWAMFSDDTSSNSPNYSSNNSSYSQYDTPAEPPTPSASSNNNFHGYGAIYFDTQSDVFGWALGYQNVYEAELAALDICHQRGAIGVCEKSYSGEAKCFAIANGITKRAWALRGSKAEAESVAIQTCHEGAGEACKVPPEGSACSAW